MGQKRMQQIDLESGEIIDGFVAYVAPKRANGFRDGWVAMAQQPMIELARSGLGSEALRVFLALVGRLDFENLLVVSQAEIAAELAMKKPSVNRAIEQLARVGVLLKGPRVGVHRSYRLNPRFGWKGSASSHQKALKERMKASRIKGVIEGAMTDSKPLRDPRVADMWDEMQATRDTLPPLGGDGGCPPMPA